MRITLSFATSADLYLDDTTPNRLVLSTPADWDEVHALRRTHDAILIGAETLRRDNPALRNVATRVVITRSGNIAPNLRLFHEGEGRRIVISEQPIEALDGLAEVVVCRAPITAARIATELERRGVQRLMVEGGAHILRLFLSEQMADEMRHAINPAITLGDGLGYARFNEQLAHLPCQHRQLPDGMVVDHYTLHDDRSQEEKQLLQEAINQSRNCPLCNTCYRVGAVITTPDGGHYTGYTHETSTTHHAEQEAIKKALNDGASLKGATIYSSMEPCSKRSSEPLSCTQLILQHEFARVVFAAYEPSKFVCCEGACTLRNRGVEVRVYSEMADEVLAINSHLFGPQQS